MTADSRILAPSSSDFLLYATADGAVSVRVLFEDETAWLPQKALAELFGVKVPAISKHLGNILESGELVEGSVVSILETVEPTGCLGSGAGIGLMEVPGRRHRKR